MEKLSSKDMIKVRRLAEILRILDHPVRRAVINAVIECRTCSIDQVSDMINVSRDSTAKHIYLLKGSGLLERRNNAAVRNEHSYSINKEYMEHIFELVYNHEEL